MNVPFKKNDLILFTGDSITDCDRDRNEPTELGKGYVRMLAGRLGFEKAEYNLSFRNTGIGGDRTCDMLQRWNKGCIELAPDWISILVGVNNTWRRYDQNDPTSEAVFESEYRQLLQNVKDSTSARIILCSPFLLHTEAFIVEMREDLDPKIQIVKNLATEFNAIWVDFDVAFTTALHHQLPAYWAVDGVHPTVAGHALMADIWLRAVAE
jgi:acyl-CoA thioesterase-1